MDPSMLDYGRSMRGEQPSGLSRPRLVKVRRHLQSPRVRPGGSSSSKVSSENNWWSSQENESFSGVEIPVKGGIYSSSVGQNPRGFGPGDSFLKKDCSSQGTESSSGISPNVFVFGGSSAQKNSDQWGKGGSASIAAEKLPERFQKMNVKYPDTADKSQRSVGGDHKFGSFGDSSVGISGSFGENIQANQSFIFRSGSTERVDSGISSEDKLPSYLRQLNLKDFPSETMPGDVKNTKDRFSTAGNHNPRVNTTPKASMFEFQGKAKHSHHEDQAASVLPEEMRKLKIEVPCNCSREEENKAFTFTFGSSKGAGLHNANGHNRSEGINSVNFHKGGVDIPESGKNDCKFRNENGFGFSNTSDGSDDNVKKLPEEIQKMKIADPTTSGGMDFDFLARKGASGSFSEENLTEASTFEETKTVEAVNSHENARHHLRPSKGEGISINKNDFAFGNSSENSFIPNQRDSDCFNGSFSGTLPEEIQKLKITEPSDDKMSKKTSSGFSFSSFKGASGSSINENPGGVFVFGDKSERSDPFVSAAGSSNGASFSDRGTSSSEPIPCGSFSTDASDNNNPSKTDASDYVSANSSFSSEGRNCSCAQSDENHSSNGFFVFGSKTKESKDPSIDRYEETPDELLGFDFRFSEAGVSGRNPSYTKPSIFDKKSFSQNEESSDPLVNLGNPIREQTASSFCPVFQTAVHDSVFPGFTTKKDDGHLVFSSSTSFLGGRVNVKKEASSHVQARKRRGRLKETSREKSSERKPELDAHGGCSPMDFSPCHVEGSSHEEHSRDSSRPLNSRNNSYSSNDLADEVARVSSLEFLKEGFGDSGFSFTASSSAQAPSSSSTHGHRRKFRAKARGNDSVSNLDPNANLFTYSNFEGKKVHTEVPTSMQRQEHESNRTPMVKGGVSSSASAATAQEACEKWRLRGNQAYANGDLSKAEEYYTRGVKLAAPHENSVACKRTLMLCYSNRAAARMSNGRVRGALSDCVMATEIDPGFLRAQLRTASCHLLLGETEDACNRFKRCLDGGRGSSPDQKFVFEASDGLQKVKLVADCMERASSLLQKGTASDATAALQTLSDALLISPYSESLVQMKAEALLMLRRYSDLILLLDESLESVEKNRPLLSPRSEEKDDNHSRSVGSRATVWRAYLKSRAFFYLGKLDEALVILKDSTIVKAVADRKKSDSWELLSAIVSELLRLKEAGNAAFKSGKHSEAVEHYTAALNYNIESRPFTAICFCNRAAAYQALGQITEAISDCSLAIALDPGYPKAISRRATLYEMIRDYVQSANDLRKLISLLEKKENKGGRVRPTNDVNDLPLARLRLSNVEEKTREEIRLDLYKILGVEASSDVAEIKKAYRKAALKFHPDKASQLLIRSENTDEKLWKEVANEVHGDADRLFKMIGEAYAILSDPSKRQQYDEVEIIGSVKESTTGQRRYYQPHHKHNTDRYERDEWWRSSSGTSYRTRRYYSGL
ncbi:heat shock protein DnaJ with tetratricopeptide repeat-containing protein [Wolffia australiana]